MLEWFLLEGDCRDVMADQLLPGKFDAIVTDPPYSLSFLGKAWDSFTGKTQYQAWCASWAVECLRVLKPGGWLVAFGSPRTSHRLACGIEDAGFDMRDGLVWLYGEGFPSGSVDVSKAIDKRLGAERATKRIPWSTNVMGQGIGIERPWKRQAARDGYREVAGDEPVTDEARQWHGWQTLLKPAHEPIVLARKPLAGTVAGNVLAHGAGALNTRACTVGTGTRFNPRARNKPAVNAAPLNLSDPDNGYQGRTVEGRWPPNVLIDEDVAGELGERAAFFPVFKYHPKAKTRERPTAEGVTVHPTVKPLGLMRWLVRLVTPPGGLILDPFAGTGTTAEAAVLEGMRCVLIERDPDYLKLIDARWAKTMQTELAA